MAQRPKGLLELLARAGSEGFGVASNLAVPMYQMRQRESQDARDFQANQDYRQQTLAQDENQFQRNLNAQNYRTMLDTQRHAADRSADYMEKMGKPNVPGNLYESLWTARQGGDPNEIAYWEQVRRELNAFENRPIKETAPKMPPNVLGNAREGYKDVVQDWNYDVIPDWQKDPTGKTFQTNPMRGMMPSKEDYFNENVAPTVPSLMRQDPQAFGPRALDSLYEGFVGKPRNPQPRTANPVGAFSPLTNAPSPVEDQWGAGEFDDWGTLTPDEKAAVIRKARTEGRLR